MSWVRDKKKFHFTFSVAALVQYGVAEIQRLVAQFRPLLGNCDTDSALREWTDLKAYIVRNQHFVGIHPLAVFQRISAEDQNTGHYKNILQIIHLTSLFPLSNASCERGFSTMKRIKSDWRNRLNNDTLNILMRIDMNNKKLQEFEPRPVVNRWWISGMRIKRPNIAPYGPHQWSKDLSWLELLKCFGKFPWEYLMCHCCSSANTHLHVMSLWYQLRIIKPYTKNVNFPQIFILACRF